MSRRRESKKLPFIFILYLLNRYHCILPLNCHDCDNIFCSSCGWRRVDIIKSILFVVDCQHFMEIVYSLDLQSKTSFCFSNIILILGYSLVLEVLFVVVAASAHNLNVPNKQAAATRKRFRILAIHSHPRTIINQCRFFKRIRHKMRTIKLRKPFKIAHLIQYMKMMKLRSMRLV